MKILVPLKQVADPDHAARLRVVDDGISLDETTVERRMNPFDEYALETALRLTENSQHPRQRLGEVVVVTVGTKTTEPMLRSALATGADRALRVEHHDEALDARIVAGVLAALVRRENFDLVLMGKQSVDDDTNDVAQRLAGMLDFPQSTFTAKIEQVDTDRLLVEREIDGGRHRLALTLPAVISVDLRIVSPGQVRSLHTPLEYRCPPGVRFASLPSIMQSKRKPLDCLDLDALIEPCTPQLQYVRVHAPRPRTPGKLVGSAEELARLLRTEAKVF